DRLIEPYGATPAPALADPSAALQTALENPYHYPQLRQSLTPDDHVAVLVEERLPRLPELLNALLEHLAAARIAPEAVTLIGPAGAAAEPGWREQLAPRFRDVPYVVHDPAEREQLRYVDTTQEGRRLYLNRAAVDADFLVILAAERFDPLLGYAGGETALYPAFTDQSTREELWGELSAEAPGDEPWALREEAGEAPCLFGNPFLVQLLEGPGDSIAHIVAGV